MRSRFVLPCALLLVFGVSCQQTQGPQESDRALTDDPAALDRQTTEGPPVMVVTGRYIFPRVVAGIEEPPLSIDLPSGKSVEFCWTVAGPNEGHEYRYGWDILDLNDDMAWETDFVPFTDGEACSTPRTFSFGVHVFHVEVMDDTGQRTRAGFRVNIVPLFTEAAIDIRPHLCPNPLAMRSRGFLRVVLLGTPELDVNDVIPESLRLGDALPVRTVIRDIATPSPEGGECACSDTGLDGYDDMILTFRLRDLEEPTPRPWRRGSRIEVVLFLWGSTGEDPEFVGSDCVLVPGPPRSCHRPAGRDGDVLAQ